jgi:acyl-CoA thioesterase FadM
VEFHHLDTGALIAKAKTTWCLLDATSMRPKRVEEVVGIFT